MKHFFSALLWLTILIPPTLNGYNQNGNFVMEFALQNDGTPTYSLNYKSKAVVKPSKLGLELKMTKNHC
jgi:hypothetical protein